MHRRISSKHCYNHLAVAESKKLRLVLDLCHVNSFIKQRKFRYGNLTTLSGILSEKDYFTTFNLSSGYNHIEIHPEHQKFLGFESSIEDGSTNYFQFCVLHSVCHQQVTFFEFRASLSFELAKTAGELVKNDLVSTGFVINVEKSDFNPKTKGK